MEPRKRVIVKIIGRTSLGTSRSLPDNPKEWRISEVAKNRPPAEWGKVFEESSNEFLKIDALIESQKRKGKAIYPYPFQTFYAFEACPLSKVKVVIFGQDPYPDLDQNGNPRAIGMSFAVSKGVEIPVSANKIYKMIKKSYPNFSSPKHADWTKWANQGILFLNSSLTVNANEPNSHENWWDGFFKRVLDELNKINRKVIYLLWGGPAQRLESKIPYEHAVILTAPHPVARNLKDDDPNSFVSCGHFAKINELLKEWGEDEIDWSLD